MYTKTNIQTVKEDQLRSPQGDLVYLYSEQMSAGTIISIRKLKKKKKGTIISSLPGS